MSSSPPSSATTRAAPPLVPKPVSMTVGTGDFTITGQTEIVAEPGSAAQALAGDLAAYLRPATGYPLPVTSGPGGDGDIRLVLGDAPELTPGQAAEGYVLDAGPDGVHLAADTAHGLFNGVQTIRQLLPATIASRTTATGPWTMPAVTSSTIRATTTAASCSTSPGTTRRRRDGRAADRRSVAVQDQHPAPAPQRRPGLPARHQRLPAADRHRGPGSVGTDGRTMDPGGFWTQEQYRSVVAYAAAHFMTVVPEVDTPGHNNAIIMSEYDDTGNPRLYGHPQDINCSVHNPPQWDYTGDVGFSALCPESENTWTICARSSPSSRRCRPARTTTSAATRCPPPC